MDLENQKETEQVLSSETVLYELQALENGGHGLVFQAGPVECETTTDRDIRMRRRKRVIPKQKQVELIPQDEGNGPSNFQSFQSRDLTLISALGKDITLANYKVKGSNRFVVVECASRNSKLDLMSGDELIHKLSHPHVIEILGIYSAEIRYIVLEYASVGPLDIFLRKRPTFAIGNILKLLQRVAQGMVYLCDKRIVHCYLAARNILLVSEQLAKVSNFSHLRLLQSHEASCLVDANEFKEHIKWTAPECHRLNTMSLKSDVWSFGTILWEALSYGSTPYDGMADVKVLEMIDAGKRLEKPVNCSDEMYSLMRRCWKDAEDERPSFQEIESCLSYELESVVSSNFTNLNETDICSEQNISKIDTGDLTLISTIGYGAFTRSDLHRLKQNGSYFLVMAEELVYETEELSQKHKINHPLKQAKTLGRLNHANIIRLIGVCDTTSQQILITEYALYGPIDDFLKQHLHTPVETVLKLLYQVAQGMAHLETNRIVHCCLAARNIFLVSPNHAKVSNFSYSEELEPTKSCCSKNLKDDKSLMKWLAPESLNNDEFSSKSDVWSFGITLWESLSYGEEPFQGCEHLWEIQKNHKNKDNMAKPEKCPDYVFYLMLECWCDIIEYRPSFNKIVWTFGSIFKQMSLQPVKLSHKTSQSLYNIELSQLTFTKELDEGAFWKQSVGSIKVENRMSPVVLRTVDSNMLTALTAFTHEIEIMSELRHPFIVRNIGICLSLESVTIVAKSSELGSLPCFIRENQPVSNATLVRLMHQVVQGMLYLQDRRILHLNLEASNIYMMSEHHAAIGNFQMSRQLECKQHSCHIDVADHIFKARWCAPEFFLSERVDYKSDVWSFGATLWEIFSQDKLKYRANDYSKRTQGSYDLKFDKPHKCSKKLYDLMLDCWEENSIDRPRFDGVLDVLEEELRDLFRVEPSSLKVVETLNGGDFGPAMLARYKSDSISSLVIVGKCDSGQDQRNHLSLMLKVRHEYIAKFIGFCESGQLDIVVELLSYGRLDTFIAKNPNTSTENLLHLIYQVAQGMAYLEGMRVLHLKLRAGSIQLRTPHHAKICSCEMSRELPSKTDFVSIGMSDYIVWYSRWAAPEFLKYNTANPKSDVWSFGIMFWEVMSKGVKPYPDKSNREFYLSSMNSKTLEKPLNCSQEAYDLMLTCWQINPANRPTFEELQESCSALLTKPELEVLDYGTPSASNSLEEINTIGSLKLISNNKVICKGKFGSVMKGVYTSNDAGEKMVSVETVQNPDDSFEASKLFVHELQMLSKLRHETIIESIGMCAGDRPMLVTEFAEFGSMREFLIKHRTTPIERVLGWMHQVVEGMTYMKTCRIVHKNLKAENILLTSQTRAKISNFAYSEEILSNNSPKSCDFKERKSFLRWSAPECLQSRRFYMNSDVFSFGITLWEATSYGATPYGEDTDAEVRHRILNSIVLSRPTFCPQELYNLMLACWKTPVQNRPEFEEIRNELKQPEKYCAHLK